MTAVSMEEHEKVANGEKSRVPSGYLTVDKAKENAPKDLKEEDVEGVFGGKVRVKSLTAAQSARVKQVSINMSGRNPDVIWAAMELLQFEYGVIIPKFDADDVRTLHLESGPSFAKVIAKIDELSGTDKEEMAKAQAAFPESGE